MNRSSFLTLFFKKRGKHWWKTRVNLSGSELFNLKKILLLESVHFYRGVGSSLNIPGEKLRGGRNLPLIIEIIHGGILVTPLGLPGVFLQNSNWRVTCYVQLYIQIQTFPSSSIKSYNASLPNLNQEIVIKEKLMLVVYCKLQSKSNINIITWS